MQRRTLRQCTTIGAKPANLRMLPASAPHHPAVIEVRALHKKFKQVDAVNGISFDVQRGTTTALLGGNGAGKTTTLSMLLGVLTPSAGAIRILDEPMPARRYHVLPRINFTSPYVDLPKRLTVGEDL